MKEVNAALLEEDIHKGLLWGPKAMASIKYATVTSCCVEQIFSSYKNVLRPNRMYFAIDNNLHLYACTVQQFNLKMNIMFSIKTL